MLGVAIVMNMPLEVNPAQALAGAVLGLLLGSLFSDALKRIWSAIGQFVSLRKVRRIGGRWRSKYWYVNDAGARIEHTDTIRITQRGVYVSGKNEGDTDHEYEMAGRFRNEIVLSGTWTSTKPEVVYHGTFQLVVSANGKRMNGRWLGLSNEHLVRDGEWQCERIA